LYQIILEVTMLRALSGLWWTRGWPCCFIWRRSRIDFYEKTFSFRV